MPTQEERKVAALQELLDAEAETWTVHQAQLRLDNRKRDAQLRLSRAVSVVRDLNLVAER